MQVALKYLLKGCVMGSFTMDTCKLTRPFLGLLTAMAARDYSMPRRVNRWACLFVGAALLLLGACSDSNNDQVGSAVIYHDHAVGLTLRTFVDTSRGTAAHGTVPESSERIL